MSYIRHTTFWMHFVHCHFLPFHFQYTIFCTQYFNIGDVFSTYFDMMGEGSCCASSLVFVITKKDLPKRFKQASSNQKTRERKERMRARPASIEDTHPPFLHHLLCNNFDSRSSPPCQTCLVTLLQHLQEKLIYLRASLLLLWFFPYHSC